MATVIRAWRIVNDAPSEIAEVTAAEQGLLEDRLETWLANQSDAIQDNLLIIGRQVDTASGTLDLLGVTADGLVVVIELKRDRAPRETVAQAIDYASWISTQSVEELDAIARSYLQRDLEEAFQAKFGQPLPDLQLSTPTILVVASRLDAPTERMIQWLSGKFGMDIDGLVFRYLRFSSGDELLVRTSVVSEEKRIVAGAGTSHYRTPDQLMSLADARGAGPIVTSLRKLADLLSEQAVSTYGGSFRYFGSGRMLCGVNAATAWGAPVGTADVWVSHGSWAQAFGLPEDRCINDLVSRFEVVKRYLNARQIVLRMKSVADAEEFFGLISHWSGSQGESSSNATDYDGVEPSGVVTGTTGGLDS